MDRRAPLLGVPRYAIPAILHIVADDARIVLGMEPQFEELSARITKDVTAAVTKEVTAAVAKEVTTVVTNEVTAVVTKEVTTAVNAHVTEVLTAAERRLGEQALAHREELVRVVGGQVSAAERRLSEQAQANVEAVREQAKLAAEGYAATLDSINRHLHGIEAAVGIKFADHDKVLASHGDRLTALERSRM